MKKLLASLSVGLVPALLFAQSDFSSVDSALETVQGFIADLIPFAIGIAVLVFIWGLIKYVTAGGDGDKQTEARNTIIWGIIIIFVMVSVWGLVNVLSTTFNLDNDNIPLAPGIPESNY